MNKFHRIYANGNVRMDEKFIHYDYKNKTGNIFKSTKVTNSGYVAIDSVSNANILCEASYKLFAKIASIVIALACASIFVAFIRNWSRQPVIGMLLFTLAAVFAVIFFLIRPASSGVVTLYSRGNRISIELTSKEEAERFLGDLEELHSYTANSNAMILETLEYMAYGDYDGDDTDSTKQDSIKQDNAVTEADVAEEVVSEAAVAEEDVAEEV